MKRAKLEPYQAKITTYVDPQETHARDGSGDTGLGNPVKVSPTVAHRFHKSGRIVPRTDVELTTACQAIITNETRLLNDQNRPGEEL